MNVTWGSDNVDQWTWTERVNVQEHDNNLCGVCFSDFVYWMFEATMIKDENILFLDQKKK